MNKLKCLALLFAVLLLCAPLPALAEETDVLAVFLMGSPEEQYPVGTNTLREIVGRAIATNPEVDAAWEAFRAATDEVDVARGGYFPSLDLSGRAGYEHFHTSSRDDDYNPLEASLALTQMIYDGFSTRNDVQRLGYEKLAQFYDLLDASESTALEAVRAYIDVLRFRDLLGFAEENLSKHEGVYSQVQDRVRVGISRGVDLEQAAGRLALARSNRLTESNNLHDVSARFLRIVGELPQPELDPPTDLSTEFLPSDAQKALRHAFHENPSFNAAFERVYAARKAKDIRKAAFLPRLDFKARHDLGDERDQIDGHSNESVVELALNFNLFRGGSDSASLKRFKRLIDQARSLREKTCRDVRQTLTIAYHDISNLEMQLTYLKKHRDSIAKARESYQNQFEIGQRTLLDLLDTENEYFQTRRAYTAASYDYILAYARTLAGMGELLNALDIRDEKLPSISSLRAQSEDRDPETFCPIEAVPEALYNTASEIAAEAPPFEKDADYDGDGVPFSKDKCPGTPAGVKVDEKGCPATAPSPTGAMAPPPSAASASTDRIQINFDFDKSVVPEEHLGDITRLAETLKMHPASNVFLGGHTDNRGSSDYNTRLSRDRVEAVRKMLIGTHDISADRIFISWFKFDQPIADNASETGRSLNRRVEARMSGGFGSQ